MNEINRVLRAASIRIAVTNFLFGVILTLTAALVVVVILRVVQQASSNLIINWKHVAYGGAAVCVLGGVIWAIISNPKRLAVARRVDEGAALKESLSTALCVASTQNQDPWARATVETATRTARGVPLNRAVPIHPPKFWPVPLALALACAIIFIAVPKIDWFQVKPGLLAQSTQQADIQQARQDAIDATKKVEQMAEKLGLEKEKTEPIEAQKPEPKTPEDIRKSAIKELTKMNDRLEELRTGEKAQKLEAVQNQLKSLKPAGEKTGDLSKAMASGNFSQAKQELMKLKEQAASAGKQGGMSEAQTKEMAKQIDDLAKQMEKMAQNKEALEKQLQAAGLDPKLAGDPNALQKALQQAPGLSSEQKQQLQNAAQAQQGAQQAMQQMAQSMQQMAQSMQSGDPQGMQQSAHR